MLIDYTRKIFSKEIIKLVLIFIDYIDYELFLIDEKIIIKEFLEYILIKNQSILDISRSINKTFSVGDLNFFKRLKLLLSNNVKTKESICKNNEEFQNRFEKN